MGALFGFIIMCLIAYLFMSKWKRKIDDREIRIQEEARQRELARGRAIKQRMKEDEELARYRRGDYSDEDDEVDEETLKIIYGEKEDDEID